MIGQNKLFPLALLLMLGACSTADARSVQPEAAQDRPPSKELAFVPMSQWSQKPWSAAAAHYGELSILQAEIEALRRDVKELREAQKTARPNSNEAKQ